MSRIAIAGVSGRMGRHIVEAVLANPELSLGAASERPESPNVGKDVGVICGREALGVLAVEDLETRVGDFDVLIDFTSPEATLRHLELCQRHGKALVIGTTGFSEAEKARIQAAATTVPLVFSPNMSVGVNLCFKLLELAA